MNPEPLRVLKGSCDLLFAFDVGRWVDLETAARTLARPARPGHFRHKRRAPVYFQFEKPPLRVRLDDDVECVLFDFGAVLVVYTIPAEGTVRDLFRAAAAEERAADARRRVEELVALLGRAVEAPELSPLVEDYLVYRVEDWTPRAEPPEIVTRHAPELARLLREEDEDLSPDEVGDAVAARISFGPADLTLVDWNAAIVFGTETEDVGEVLEFVNVQLLEMRLLDAQLDRSLDRAYEMLTARRRFLRFVTRAQMRGLGRMQVDAAILYERVRNALKLLTDQFLARLYRLAAQRFHLNEWDASIRRKLETIESIYQKVFDRSATYRMEALEWLIIVLIAAGIVLPLVLPRLF